MRFPTLPILTLSLLLAGAHPAGAQDIKSPQELYGKYPTRLADIPPHWETENPLQLQVLFNLKYPVNSPEANAFLKRYVAFLKSLPDAIDLKVYRVMSAGKYSYATRIGFRNWREFQIYDKRPEFLKFYYDVWKPNVPEAEELLTVLDVQTTEAR